MKLYFWVVSWLLAFALLWFLPLCSLPPASSEMEEHRAYIVKVTVGAIVVGGLALALVIGWLSVRREQT